MLKGYIYGLSLRDNPTYIRYVGQTRVSPESRMYYHLRDSKYSSRPVCKWITKYGASNIEMLVLEECSIELIDEHEIWWIASFRQWVPNLLNVAIGGVGKRGVTISYETRQKQSKAQLGNKNAAGNKGKKHSLETRQKQSKARLGARQTEATKLKLSLARQGENGPNSRLSDVQRREIKNRLIMGEPRKLLAKEFNISLRTIDRLHQKAKEGDRIRNENS